MTSHVIPLARTRPFAVARRVVRAVAGLLLGLTAVAAVTGAALVLFLHLGFAPILSPSMQPALAPGDLALTRTVPAHEVAVGDVVVLPRPDAPGERYAHRVVSVTHSDGQPVVRTKVTRTRPPTRRRCASPRPPCRQ